VNIVFFGTSEFAIPAFKKLFNSGHKVLALVTQPDRKRGRNLKLSPPPTKVLAGTHGVPIYQPQDVSGAESVEYLKGLGAEVFVVIAFGQILKKLVLDIPKSYSINLHGSLLPKYRGAAPTNWAVMNGDKSSGVTIIKMNERMDEGDMITRKETEIELEDTNITLSEKLSELGADVLLETIGAIDGKKALKFEKQDPSLASYAPKLKKEDGLIDWSWPAAKIHDRVRGLIPWPGAYTYYNKKILKILNTELAGCPVRGKCEPGEVMEIMKGTGIVVATGSGALVIRYLQQEGGKIMDADSFVRGHRIGAGHIFSA